MCWNDFNYYGIFTYVKGEAHSLFWCIWTKEWEDMAIRIGLTGGISSGKSTISKWLREWGYPVIDADEVAKKVMEKGELAYLKVVEAFSPEILLENGEIDRVKLGGMIFPNEALRNQLNQIVHPIVHKEMEKIGQMYIENGHSIVVFDVPLLLEGKMHMKMDVILVVSVDENTQLERLMKRNGLTKEAAESRIHAQMSTAERLCYADFVIDNQGTLEETKEQLKKVMNDIEKIEN